jgi:hypothetical protein
MLSVVIACDNAKRLRKGALATTQVGTCFGLPVDCFAPLAMTW